jgi:hypothetical protein
MATHEALWGFFFISPWIVGFLALQLGPMLASLALSFTEYQIVAPPKFVGFANYVRMFTADVSFWAALKVTFARDRGGAPAAGRWIAGCSPDEPESAGADAVAHGVLPAQRRRRRVGGDAVVWIFHSHSSG